MNLAGTVVVITGASGGIGRATALEFYRRGARLVLGGRDIDRLEAVAATTGGVAVPADLTGPGAPERLIETAERAFGPVDVMVHAAGAGRAAGLGELSAADAAVLLDINLRVPVELTRLVLPDMVSRRRGSIVYVGSIAGLVGVRDESVYAAAKGGLATFADSLADELRQSPVRISLIAPGAVATDFFARRGQAYTRQRPTPVTPERVARAIANAATGGSRRVVIPRWLNVAVRLHDAAPGIYRSLSGRFS